MKHSKIKIALLAAIAALLTTGCGGQIWGDVGDTKVNLSFEGNSDFKGIKIEPILGTASGNSLTNDTDTSICREVSITNGYLNVRSSPDFSASSPNILLDKDQVNLVSLQGKNGFVEINSPVDGFVHGNYLTVCKEK